MIRPEQIPDEVVEAAAKVIADANGWREKHSVSICKPVAVEAIVAAINAWPGANVFPGMQRGFTETPPHLILPLPQEKSDE
jgi:hypothetical protein